MKNEYEIRGDVTAIFIYLKGHKYETIIDTKDLPTAVSFPKRWYGAINRKKLYVYGCILSEKRKITVQLHRLLMGEPVDLIVDHINHDTLDNRRSVNLRSVTIAGNSQNRSGANRGSISGIRGVAWVKETNKWRVNMPINGKSKHFGYFNDINEAAKVAKEAREKYMPYSTN